MHAHVLWTLALLSSVCCDLDPGDIGGLVLAKCKNGKWETDLEAEVVKNRTQATVSVDIKEPGCR